MEVGCVFSHDNTFFGMENNIYFVFLYSVGFTTFSGGGVSKWGFGQLCGFLLGRGVGAA